MHPIIVNKKILITYLLAWGVIGIAIASFLEIPGAIQWLYALVYTIPLFIFYGIICLSAWYVCKYFPIRKNGLPKLFMVFGLAAFLNSSLLLFLGSEWGALLTRFFSEGDNESFGLIEPRLFFILGFTLYFLSGAGHYLFILYEETQSSQRRLIELNMLARDAELNALRSQINPHFLFNSLNSISALTTTDPKAARHMTELLADFFRKSLDAGKKKLITMKDELDLASDYLNIERIRFGTRLVIDTRIQEDCLKKTVPPLILQPIIENAVKHGIAHLVDGGTVTIRAECTKKSLMVSIENPCDPERPKGRGNQLGLDNIRKRLKTIYDSKSDVIVREENNIFMVNLIIRE